MLDKDNIISTSVSEAVEKIPADEKDYHKCSFMCFFCTATAYKEQLCTAMPQHTISRPTYNYHRNSCLPTRMHPV